MPPVSVCHQVSTIGQRLAPMTCWYQIQASGLMGSPTVPSKRNELKSCFLGHSVPHFMKARMVITADGGFRRGAVVPLKQSVDEALMLKAASGELLAKSIDKVIVLRRARNEVQMQDGRDLWWHEQIDLVDARCPAEKMDSEAPLFILYTSGSTGKPKGILHTTAGYLHVRAERLAQIESPLGLLDLKSPLVT